MDCLYTFPLPAGAAVYRCEMHVNGRVIRARVEERERAREIAREQKAAGRRTDLVEMERENLFTLALGNLQPGDMRPRGGINPDHGRTGGQRRSDFRLSPRASKRAGAYLRH